MLRQAIKILASFRCFINQIAVVAHPIDNRDEIANESRNLTFKNSDPISHDIFIVDVYIETLINYCKTRRNKKLRDLFANREKESQ